MHIFIHWDYDITFGESNHPSDLVTRSFFWILGFNTSLQRVWWTFLHFWFKSYGQTFGF